MSFKFLKKISFPINIFFASRLFIFSLALIFIGLWPTRAHPSFLEAFAQWDGQWYLKILKDGYWYKGPNVQSPVAFFPLYPLLGKFLTFLGFSPELSLFLVTNLSCLGFFVVFWLLMKKEFSEKIAEEALFYYALSPLSYVLSSLYTESLFLFLSCFCFYWLRKNRFWAACLMAGLASATRPFGVILVLPIVFSAWRKKKNFWSLFNFGWIASLGLTSYCFYLYFKVGEWVPFLGVQASAWRRPWRWPWESLELFWDSVQFFHSWHPLFPLAVFDLTIVSLFSVLLVFSLREIDFVYQIFMWPVYFSSLGQPWEPSFFLASGAVSRYLFQLFPLFGLLAKVGRQNKLVHYLIIFFFAALMGPFSLAFFHGFWVE